MKNYKNKRIEDGLKVWGRDAEIDKCYISNKSLSANASYDIKKQAGVLLWGGSLKIENTAIHDSQRAVCAFDYSWIPKGQNQLPKSNVFLKNVHFVNSNNVLEKPNHSESFLIHLRTKNKKMRRI